MDDYLVDQAGRGYRRRFRYTTNNLRHSYRSYYAAPIATNRSTHGLYNASSGPLVVVLRGCSFNGYASATNVALSTVQGIIGTDLGAEYPLWPGDPQPAAVHTYIDTTTIYPPQVLISGAVGAYLISAAGVALGIAPPGWSIVVQNNVNAGTVVFNWFWEELDINDPELGTVLA